MTAVRLAGYRAEGGEFVRVKRHHIATLRAAVRKCFELGILRGAEEFGVLAEQGKIFVVHNLRLW